MRALLDEGHVSWSCHIMAGRRDQKWLGFLPAHTKRLHTYHVPAEISWKLGGGGGCGQAGGSCEQSRHEFWPADVNMLAGYIIDWTRVLGHRQVTEIYLLALAAKHGVRFVMFDRRIVLDTVKGVRANHLVALD